MYGIGSMYPYIRIVADGEHFVMSIPPHADDIIYEDLNNDMEEQSTMDITS